MHNNTFKNIVIRIYQCNAWYLTKVTTLKVQCERIFQQCLSSKNNSKSTYLLGVRMQIVISNSVLRERRTDISDV